LAIDENKSEGVDQKGFVVQSLRSEDRDIEDASCSYPMIHKPSEFDKCKSWKLIPVNASNQLYNIVLDYDDLKKGGINQTGW